MKELSYFGTKNWISIILNANVDPDSDLETNSVRIGVKSLTQDWILDDGKGGARGWGQDQQLLLMDLQCYMLERI